MKYVIEFKSDSSDVNWAQLHYEFESDAQAVKEVRALVSDGFRNKAVGHVVLSDGRTYSVQNHHGVAARGVYSS